MMASLSDEPNEEKTNAKPRKTPKNHLKRHLDSIEMKQMYNVPGLLQLRLKSPFLEGEKLTRNHGLE